MKLSFERSVSSFGNSLAITVPTDIAVSLNVQKGDTIVWTFEDNRITIKFKKTSDNNKNERGIENERDRNSDKKES